MPNFDLTPEQLDRLQNKPIKGEYARERKTKERRHKDREAAIMRAVIAEDGHKCRVPGCRTDLRVACAHEDHRGMGGNPSEDRTVPEKLIALCVTHHAYYDRGELVITPLTDRRLRGQCVYEFKGAYLGTDSIHRISVERSIR